MDNLLLLDCDDEIKVNKNELNDNIKLSYINHYLNIKFPPIPFLWHYDDFALPFPIYGIKKISIYKLKNLLNNQNKIFNKLISGTNDKNCDIYILAQYKKEKVIYNETSNQNELYISYHSWLYNNLTKSEIIKNEKINLKFRFLTGIFSIDGNIKQYENYPYKNDKKKSFGGICVDNHKLDMRQATIHEHNDNIKFSGINVCNFDQMSDNCVFLSIMEYPHLCSNNDKLKIYTSSKKAKCIVLHIFRNVYDNNPNDSNYQKLINKYM